MRSHRIATGIAHLLLVALAPLLLGPSSYQDYFRICRGVGLLPLALGSLAVLVTLVVTDVRKRWAQWIAPNVLAVGSTWLAMRDGSEDAFDGLGLAAFSIGAALAAISAQLTLGVKGNARLGSRTVQLGCVALLGLGGAMLSTHGQSASAWFAAALVLASMVALIGADSRVSASPAARPVASDVRRAAAIIVGTGLMLPALAAVSAGGAMLAARGHVGVDSAAAWCGMLCAARADWAYSIPLMATLLIAFAGRWSLAGLAARSATLKALRFTLAAGLPLALLLASARIIHAPGTTASTTSASHADSRPSMSAKAALQARRDASPPLNSSLVQTAARRAPIGAEDPLRVGPKASDSGGRVAGAPTAAPLAGEVPLAEPHRAVTLTVDVNDGISATEAQANLDQRIDAVEACQQAEPTSPSEFKLRVRVTPKGSVSYVGPVDLNSRDDPRVGCVLLAIYRMGFAPRANNTVGKLELTVRFEDRVP